MIGAKEDSSGTKNTANRTELAISIAFPEMLLLLRLIRSICLLCSFVVVWPSKRLSFRQNIRPFTLSGIWFRNDLCSCRCWYGRWCCWSVDTSFLNCGANPVPVLSGHKLQSCVRNRVAKTNFKFDSEAANRLKLGRIIKYRKNFCQLPEWSKGKTSIDCTSDLISV